MVLKLFRKLAFKDPLQGFSKNKTIEILTFKIILKIYHKLFSNYFNTKKKARARFRVIKESRKTKDVEKVEKSFCGADESFSI